jgi:hypothetical protein
VYSSILVAAAAAAKRRRSMGMAKQASKQTNKM